jgi:hypothetical protein
MYTANPVHRVNRLDGIVYYMIFECFHVFTQLGGLGKKEKPLNIRRVGRKGRSSVRILLDFVILYDRNM